MPVHGSDLRSARAQTPAGIQCFAKDWVPAFAGTRGWNVRTPRHAQFSTRPSCSVISVAFPRIWPHQPETLPFLKRIFGIAMLIAASGAPPLWSGKGIATQHRFGTN